MSWKEIRQMASLSRDGLRNTFYLYEIEDVFQTSMDMMYMTLFDKNSDQLKEIMKLSKESTDDAIRDNLCEDALMMIIGYENKINKSLIEKTHNEEFQKSLLMKYRLLSPFHDSELFLTINRPIYRSPLRVPNSTVLD